MIKDILKLNLELSRNDSAVDRADLIRDLIRDVYKFVKFERPGGEGLDGRNGTERESLALILDAAENHCFEMLKLQCKK